MSDTRQPTETALDPESSWIRQRLRALRSRYPGTALRTQLTHIHDDQVVVRAELTLPDGSSVSAYAAEPSEQSGLLDGAIELAEQRATARALDLLGLGELPVNANRSEPVAETHAEPGVETPARPPDRSAPPVVDALRKASQRRPAPELQPPSVETRDEPRQDSASASWPEPAPEARREPEPETEHAPSQPAPPAAAPDEPNLADYTWTHFWTWARANDLSTKGQVEQRIGRPIDNLTPRDVRQLLHDNGVPE